MDQRLRDAAQAGDINGLYRLIQEDATVFEAVQQVGDIRQRLREAAQAGDNDGFYNLIRENANVLEAAQLRDIGQRLTRAAEAGDIGALYALIRQDARVLERIDEVPFVDTPLHIAASAGHIDFAMEIVNLMASFTRKLNPDGFSPMHLALRNEQMLMVMWLIDVDGNLVRLKGKGGITPLHYATEKGNLSILKECYKGCPESIKDVTFHGDTAFHIAVRNHQNDAFELLMEWLKKSSFKDADFWERELLNWKNEEGRTVLHIAALETGWNGQLQVLEMLLRCPYARTDIQDLAGQTARQILRDQVGLTEKQISNMQDAGTRFLFPLLLLYRSVISPRHSVNQLDNMPRLMFLVSRFLRKSKWKSSERRNTELVVETLILTAMHQASLSPPGGLWQGNATVDINSPIRVSNSSTSEATSLLLAGTSVMSQNDFEIFYILNSGLFGLTALRTVTNLLQDYSGFSLITTFSVNWLIGSYWFSMSVITPDKKAKGYFFFHVLLYVFAAYALISFVIFCILYILLPKEPQIKPRRRRQKIHVRREWWQ
ncbi:ankyrin repeat-containing protein BDA1 [Hevea brasiliensis]|uniref:ankyrin repeat-containing protein BDA1 n=1 Tax=Hevea brasiliensis TaxID=3981 RepID=UPI0025E8FE11|nr:ankyrin repeat-containing protein BDA1 [Hevea brasiliensis]